VRLRATRGQWEGIGSKVIVHGPHGPVAQLLARGAGFVSCQAPELIFGLGQLEEARVQVRWPTGELEEFGRIPAGSRAVLEQGKGAATLVEGHARRLPDPMPPGLRVNVGAKIAALELTDDAGETVTVDLAALAGEGRLFLNLWASYCGPCVAEMGYLAEVNEREGSRLICISVDGATQQNKAREILNQRAPGVSGFYLVGGESGLEDLLDLDRLPIPTTLIVNGEGQIEGIVQGVLERGDGPWR
jgi:thiol-disulfide isomerase/thioredoxin